LLFKKNIHLKKIMNPIERTFPTMPGSNTMAFDATPASQSSIASMRQSIALQAIPALASPIADRSLAERFASVVAGELVSFDLISDGVEHSETFGNVAMTLRQIIQNIGACMGQDDIMAMRADLISLVNSLEELNPEEQAAICTAKLSGNQTFPMLVTRCASGATGALLDIISGLDANTRAKVFTARDSIFPLYVVQYALEYVLGDTVGYVPEVTEKFFNAISSLDAKIQAKVFRAQDGDGETLPVLIARHGRSATEKFLDTIGGLDARIQANVFTAQTNFGFTLPIMVAQCAPQVIERLLDMIGGLDRDTRVKVLAAQVRRGTTLGYSGRAPSPTGGGTFSMYAARYAPGVTGKLLDMIGGLDENALEKIFTAQDDAKATFSMYVAQYAPEVTEKLLDTIGGLDARTRANVFTAQSSTKWTLPICAAQYAPGAIGKLSGMINDLDEDARTKVFAARSKDGWGVSLIMDWHTSGSIGRIWSEIKMRLLSSMSKT
jgi:hypothetical protein